jgi:hypothetical protein
VTGFRTVYSEILTASLNQTTHENERGGRFPQSPVLIPSAVIACIRL